MSTTSTGSSSRRRPPPDPPELPGVPADRRSVERALAGLGVSPSKRLGQSFLTDAFVADAEAALADTGAKGPVLEIGGGLGILTEALLRRGVGPVTVIEKDPRFAAHLERTFGTRVTVVRGDALEVPLPEAGVAVGNLPFSVATPILLRLFPSKLALVVALLQKEVADRLGAGPGSRTYGRLSIVAALYGSVELHQVVPAASFTPTPAVDGRLVAFTRRPGPLPVPSVPEFERVVAALFSSRRKQLGNLLPRAIPRHMAPDQLAGEAGWPSDWSRMRPEELPPEAFFRLAAEVHRRAGATPRGRFNSRRPT